MKMNEHNCIDSIDAVSVVRRAFAVVFSKVCTTGLHGNGDGGNTAVTAVMGTKFTVMPRGRGHVSRGLS